MTLSAVVAVVAVGLAVVFAGGGGEPDAVSVELTAAEGGAVALGDEVVVEIPPGGLSADATVTASRRGQVEAPPGAVALGDSFEVDLGGADLRKPARVELTYDSDRLPQHADASMVWLARRDAPGDSWVEVAEQTHEGRIQAEVKRFSEVAAFAWSPTDLGARLTEMAQKRLEDAQDAFADLWDENAETFRNAWNATTEGVRDPVALFIPKAETPTCEPFAADFSVASYSDPDYQGLLLGCPQDVGEKGSALIRVANNRAFGVSVSIDAPPGTTIDVQAVTRGSLVEDWLTTLATAPNDERLYLPGAGQADIRVTLTQPGQITFTSHPDDWVPYFETLFYALETLSTGLVAEFDSAQLKGLTKVEQAADCAIETARQGPEEPNVVDTVRAVAECAAVPVDGLSALLTFVRLEGATLQRIFDDLSRGHQYRAQLTMAYGSRGGDIVFASGPSNGTSAIFSVQPDGANVERLTDPGWDAFAPRWSPEGDRVAFLRQVEPSRLELWTMRGDGSDKRRLAAQLRGGPESQALWVPSDGSLSVLLKRSGQKGSRQEGTLAAWQCTDLVLLQDQGRFSLLRDHSWVRGAAWSPNGQQLVLTYSQPNMSTDCPGPAQDGPPNEGSLGSDGWPRQGSVWRWDRDGDWQVLFPRPPRDCFVCLAWSPAWKGDGSLVTFVSDVQCHACEEVFVVGSDGSSRRTLFPVQEGADWYGPVWSPAGTHVAALRWESDGSGQRWANVWVMTEDRSELRPVTDDRVWDKRNVVWGPEGEQIAFVRSRYSEERSASERDVVVVDMQGRETVVASLGTTQSVMLGGAPSGVNPTQ